MKVNMLGIPIDALTMEETIQRIEKAVKKGEHLHHAVVNAGKVVLMNKNPELKSSVIKADLINADGQSLVWASRFYDYKIPERVTGIDLMDNLFKLAYEKNYKIYLFGGKQDTINQTAEMVSSRYSSDIIAGYKNGYFSSEEEEKIARDIASSGAEMLFVGISSPIKENFLYRNREILKDVNFIMGVGGSFDVYCGKIKRAPKWMRKIGMEWFYRFVQEPRRLFKRYINYNIEFIFYLISDIIRYKRYQQ